jgi:AraC-like DNA-binding protein
VDTPRGLLSPQTGVGVYQEGVHPAAADLSDILAQHWAVRWDLRGRGPHTVEVLPHPAVQLVVEDGRCRIHGILRGRYSHTLDGRGDIFGTAFRPAGFRPLLGRPVTELTDRVVEGSAVFGAAAGELAGRIYDARNVEERIGIAEGFVRGRLTGAVLAAVRTVNGLVDAILADRAILKVDDIVDRYGIGKRNLEKLFREYIGVTPKWVIQRYRLHEAAERLDTAATDLSTLAYELGYADQAHFVRDFKAAVGRPPASYVRS